MGRHFGIERTSNVQGSAYITARFVRRAQCPSGRLLRIASVGSQLVPKPGHATLIGNTVHAYYAVRLMDIAFRAATIPLWEADKAQCQACSLEKAAAAGVQLTTSAALVMVGHALRAVTGLTIITFDCWRYPSTRYAPARVHPVKRSNARHARTSSRRRRWSVSTGGSERGRKNFCTTTGQAFEAGWLGYQVPRSV
jgi:hypothetical protein